MTHPVGGGGTGPAGGGGTGPGREVATFRYDNAPIRALIRDGEPWFVAMDVCAVLGIANVSDSVRSLDDDEFLAIPAALVSSEGRPQDFLNIVSEPGLYSLVLRSRKPEAKTFKRWITHEVLPAIRKTGRYEVEAAVPRTLPEALRAYATELEAHNETRAELEAARPKAEAWQVLASADGDYSVRQAAYILNRDPGIDTGQNRLFKTLREWRLIDRHDIPYADHARHVRLRPQTYWDEHTQEWRTTQQVRVTADGLRYLHRRMGGTAALQLAMPIPA